MNKEMMKNLERSTKELERIERESNRSRGNMTGRAAESSTARYEMGKRNKNLLGGVLAVCLAGAIVVAGFKLGLVDKIMNNSNNNDTDSDTQASDTIGAGDESSETDTSTPGEEETYGEHEGRLKNGTYYNYSSYMSEAKKNIVSFGPATSGREGLEKNAAENPQILASYATDILLPHELQSALDEADCNESLSKTDPTSQLIGIMLDENNLSGGKLQAALQNRYHDALNSRDGSSTKVESTTTTGPVMTEHLFALDENGKMIRDYEALQNVKDPSAIKLGVSRSERHNSSTTRVTRFAFDENGDPVVIVKEYNDDCGQQVNHPEGHVPAGRTDITDEIGEESSTEEVKQGETTVEEEVGGSYEEEGKDKTDETDDSSSDSGRSGGSSSSGGSSHSGGSSSHNDDRRPTEEKPETPKPEQKSYTNITRVDTNTEHQNESERHTTDINQHEFSTKEQPVTPQPSTVKDSYEDTVLNYINPANKFVEHTGSSDKAQVSVEQPAPERPSITVDRSADSGSNSSDSGSSRSETSSAPNTISSANDYTTDITSGENYDDTTSGFESFSNNSSSESSDTSPSAPSSSSESSTPSESYTPNESEASTQAVANAAETPISDAPSSPSLTGTDSSLEDLLR